MVSDEESWILLTELKTYLNEMGYLVTNKADEADFSVDVKAKTNRTNSPYPSAFFHWIDIRILIKTSEDPVPIYTKKWDAKKGSSNVSFDDAATKILNEVAEEIAEQNIINVIQEQLTNNIW